MALVKPLYQHASKAFPVEMSTADTIQIGGLTISSGGDIAVSGGGELTGLPATPGGATAAASKSYVDGLISGVGWKQPVVAMGLVGNATVATINGLSPTAGDAYVMTDAGDLTANDPDLTVAIGDIVEWDGTEWQIIVTNSGGYPPVDTRIVLSEQTTLVSPYTDATDNDKVMEFSGSSLTGTDTGDTVDKASVLVQDPGHIGFYDNLGFVYEGTVPSGTWIQFTGVGQIIAGAGLTKTAQTIDVGAGNGITVGADTVSVNADSTTGGNIQPVNVVANGTGVDINAIAGTGIEADGSANLRLATQGNGISGGAGSTLSVDPDSETGGNTQPVTVAANGVGVDISAIAGTGLEADGSANLRIAAAAAGDGLTGGGGSALAVNLEASNPSLQISSDELGIKFDANGGLQKAAAGTGIKIDDTPNTLDVDSSGLKVVGLPSLFEVNDVAVGATVTAANLDDLTDGSNADSLHVHSAGVATYAPKIENHWTTAVDATSDGDCVYVNGNNTVGLADSSDDDKANVIGIIRTDSGAAGSTPQVVSHGPCTGILTGATWNTAYYLQSDGSIATTLPGGGERVVQIGYALNATDLFVLIKDFAKRAA
jgi:hypothetical protein